MSGREWRRCAETEHELREMDHLTVVEFKFKTADYDLTPGRCTAGTLIDEAFGDLGSPMITWWRLP